MGQQFHTESMKKKITQFDKGSSTSSPEKSNMNLIESSGGQFKILGSQSQSDDLENLEMASQPLPDNKEDLQRIEKLIEFIGEIIYYCKLHMKKQRKYHYKISALLFYKYFYDKFRQLRAKYFVLCQKKQISREEYEKKVALVFEVKNTFVKIKKFIFSKIPFMSQKIHSFLNEDSEEYCFSKKDFFTDLVYPEVKEIMECYHENTEGEFDEVGINTCYIRMIKAIFIIEELEFGKPVVELKDKDSQPDYEIVTVEEGSDEDIQRELIKCYKTFLKLKRSQQSLM